MPTEPALFDSVTLRHFAVAEVLDLCRDLHDHRDQPRWTEAVSSEIADGVRLGQDDCLSVQECAWLGVPRAPEITDLVRIRGLQVALSDSTKITTENAGEAESIFFAEQFDGVFVTDDNFAYDFARRRRGNQRVLDSIGMLSDAVRRSLVSPDEASEIAARITDSGRHLRREHPRHPGSTYFL
jgi:predicted nucleic acid-binding protein